MTVSAGCEQRWHSRQLNPNPYRAQITLIDGVLFRNGPIKWSDRTALEQQILTLADAASADPNNETALEMSLDLRLMSTIAASGQLSAPLVNSELTRQWRRVRGSLFTSAPWFRQAPNRN
jgi:hypothetical protein